MHGQGLYQYGACFSYLVVVVQSHTVTCNGMWSRTLQKFIVRLSGNACFINLFSVLPSTNSVVVGMRIGQFEILKLQIFFFFWVGGGGDGGVRELIWIHSM